MKCLVFLIVNLLALGLSDSPTIKSVESFRRNFTHYYAKNSRKKKGYFQDLHGLPVKHFPSAFCEPSRIRMAPGPRGWPAMAQARFCREPVPMLASWRPLIPPPSMQRQCTSGRLELLLEVGCAYYPTACGPFLLSCERTARSRNPLSDTARVAFTLRPIIDTRSQRPSCAPMDSPTGLQNRSTRPLIADLTVITHGRPVVREAHPDHSFI